MRSSCFFLGLLVLLLMNAFAAAAFAQGEEYSIAQFVASQPQWSDWVGQRIRIEGRYSSFTPNAMQFQKCDLIFYLPAGLNRPAGRSRTMEVTGSLQSEKGELSFRVEALRLLMEDADLFHLRRRAIPAEDYEALYQLGQQTAERGEFYGDVILTRLGREALEEALLREKKQQEKLNAPFLSALADKALTLKLSPRLRQDLLHEAGRLGWKKMKTEAKPDFAALRQQIGHQLPGSRLPLTSLDHVLFEEYKNSPVETFREATDQARQQLSRLFYLQVLREEYQRRLTARPAHGDQLADEYSKLAPEDTAQAEEFRQQAFLFRTQNVGAATREQVLELAEQFRAKKQPEMAQRMLKTWLQHRESLLVKAGPTDFLQISHDVQAWLQDENWSAEILLSGIQKFPDDVRLKGELQKHDYVLHQGDWVKKSVHRAQPLSKIDAALQAGRIIAGMTPVQVLSSLGSPHTMSQIASADQNQLIWTYPDAKLAIRFQQRRTQQDYVVVEIRPLRPAFSPAVNPPAGN